MYMYLSICQTVCQSVCLSNCYFGCLFVHTCMYLSVSLFMCVSACLNVCLSIFVFVLLSLCLSVHSSSSSSFISHFKIFYTNSTMVGWGDQACRRGHLSCQYVDVSFHMLTGSYMFRHIHYYITTFMYLFQTYVLIHFPIIYVSSGAKS